jgi:hypothetical protein
MQELRPDIYFSHPRIRKQEKLGYQIAFSSEDGSHFQLLISESVKISPEVIFSMSMIW